MNRHNPTLLVIVAVCSLAFVYEESYEIRGFLNANTATGTATGTATTAASRTALHRNAEHDRGHDHDHDYDYVHVYSSTQSGDYGWLGFTWVPPPGVPFFGGSEIRRLFQSENTLWLGDSTARQDYQTMIAVMNAKNPDNVNIEKLDENINKNKFSHVDHKPLGEPLHCPNRQPPKNLTCVHPCMGGIVYLDMGQVKGTDDYCALGRRKENFTVDDLFAIGKFDYSVAPCYNSVTSLLRSHAADTIRKNYSVLIASLGIWDTMVSETCDVDNTTSADRIVTALEELKRISGPSLLVVWKTHGPHAREEGIKSNTLNQKAQEWFEKKRPEYMHLADVGGVVNRTNRAFGDDRNDGDLPAHWGAETRILGIQMASHAIHMKQQSQSNLPE